MKLGGPVEQDWLDVIGDELATNLEYGAQGRPNRPPPDEDVDGGWQNGISDFLNEIKPGVPNKPN